MKCFESQTTSIARSTAPQHAVRDAAASFEALVVREAFAPLAKAIGFYGDTVVAAAAQAMARSERGGLTDRLERSMRVPEPPDSATDAVSR
jgi:hypothetical protein